MGSRARVAGAHGGQVRDFADLRKRERPSDHARASKLILTRVSAGIFVLYPFLLPLCSWLHRPIPLVALVGCQDLHERVRSDVPKNKPLAFISREVDASFPPKKNKPEVKDWDAFRARGILRSNWVEKHRNRDPAVVCVMYDWDDKTSEHAHSTALASRAMAVRTRASSRGVLDIVVVAVRKTVPQDSTFEDRHRGICRDAGLSSKNFFALFPADGSDFARSLRRLEDYIYTLACRRYREFYKRVRRLRDRVPKSQGELQVRYNFKMGFYSEFYGDQATALTNYTSAYNALTMLKLGKESERTLEVKTVAELIVFKVSDKGARRGADRIIHVLFYIISGASRLCLSGRAHARTHNDSAPTPHPLPKTLAQVIHLLLESKEVDKAVEQFRHHVSFYRGYTGIPSLAFHHFAWLSRQNRMFAEFYAAAPSARKRWTRAQNPGLYYQAAANYAKKRKAAAGEALAATGMTKLQPQLAKLPKTEYLGQVLTDAEKTLRAHQSSTSSIHSHVVVQRILMQESSAKHSDIVLDRLTSAYEHFKRQKASRMILHIAYQMAEEYMSENQFTLAQKFYNRIASKYRREKWQVMLAQILERSLLCAERLGAAPAKVRCTIELLSPALGVDAKRRADIMTTLSDVNLGIPVPVAAIADRGLDLDNVMCFDLPRSYGLLRCGAHFSQQVGAGAGRRTAIRFRLLVRSDFPGDLKFSKIQVVFKESLAPALTILPSKDKPTQAEEAKKSAEEIKKSDGIVVYADLSFSDASSRARTFESEFHVERPPGGRAEVSVSHVLFAIDSTRSDVVSAAASVPISAPADAAPGDAKSGETKTAPSIPVVLKTLCSPWAGVEAKGTGQRADSAMKPGARRALVRRGSVRTAMLRLDKPVARASLSVSQNVPGIVAERYPFTIEIDSKTDTAAVGATLSLVCVAAEGKRTNVASLDGRLLRFGLWEAAADGAGGRNVDFPGRAAVAPLGRGEKRAVHVWVEASRAVRCPCIAVFEYENEYGETVATEKPFTLSFVKPFSAVFNVFPETTTLIPITKLKYSGSCVVRGKPFLLHANIENTAKHDLMIGGVKIDFSRARPDCEIEVLDAPPVDVAPTRALPGEKRTFSFLLRAGRGDVCRGAALVLRWRRAEQDDGGGDSKIGGDTGEAKAFDTRVGVPSIAVADPAFDVEIDAPRQAVALQPVQLRLRVRNKTASVEEVTVKARTDGPDQVCAGPTDATVTIPPRSMLDLRFDLTFLKAGPASLPRVQLYSAHYAKYLYDVGNLGSVFVSSHGAATASAEKDKTA